MQPFPPGRYCLPRELVDSCLVDSWRVREFPAFGAPVAAVITSGEQFDVLSADGQWLQVSLRGKTGWCYPFHQTAAGAVPALQPVAHPDRQLERTGSAASVEESSTQGHVNRLAADLGAARARLAEATSPRDQVAAAVEVQRLNAELELFGVDALELDPGGQLPEAALTASLHRGESFNHADFTNPHAESCWLSTLFQGLWHSRVFHAAFEQIVAGMPQLDSKSALGAWQRTWQAYSRNSSEDGYLLGRAVPVTPLVRAWGRGYGDTAELESEMDKCSSQAVRQLSKLWCIVPVPFTGQAPTTAQVWEQLSGWGLTDKPMVLVEITLPELTSRSVHRAVSSLAPMSHEADLGPRHRLVAMICFQHKYRHYVVFCRRISAPDEWIFFNDIPGLSRGAYDYYTGWDEVAGACSKYGLTPKLLVYESVQAAEEMVEDSLSNSSASTASTPAQCALM